MSLIQYCITHSPSRWGAGMVVMKNWLPLVSGPVLAMLSIPGIS